MPRPPRENAGGAVYHVYARGTAKGVICRDDTDFRSYLGLLRTVVERKQWRCLAYCLMPNHVHLLIETPLPNLSSGMQYLQGRYAQMFNARHDRTGHLFEGRYGAVLVEDDEQLAVVVAYIANNPVKAGLCRDPVGWPWSGYESTRPLRRAASS